MSQHEISAMRDTLAAQQHLLQQLYNELEAERESAATAASEALSVILRLQGEKAAVKMEAEQYKRLAEERLCHAEESVAIIEDIIYQRDMEVAALDDQVQSYRHKLQSMGVVVDPAAAGSESTCGGETTNLWRRNSAPVLHKYKQALMEWESDIAAKNSEEKMDQELNDFLRAAVGNSPHGEGVNYSYAEDIEKLDIRVKELAAGNSFASPTSLPSRPASTTNLCPCPRPPTAKTGNQNTNCEAAFVHDIFEVPQVDKVGAKYFEVPQVDEVIPDWLIKKLFELSGHEFKPSHVAAMNSGVVQPMTCLDSLQDETKAYVCLLPEAMIHFWL